MEVQPGDRAVDFEWDAAKMRGDVVRIISARKATKVEHDDYFQVP